MQQLDHVRHLILARAKEKRLSLADLSRGVGKNAAYVHQFIHKGSPRVLPEDVRLALGSLLDLPDSELHHNPLARMPAAAAPAPSGRDLPVFSDALPFDRERVGEHIPRPALFSGLRDAFALWISKPGGRLVVGDLAYVHPHQPARPGDTVAVVEGEGVAPCCGELLSIENKTATVRVAHGVISCPAPAAYRVVGALFG